MPEDTVKPFDGSSSSGTNCKHDTWRHAQTYPPDPRTLTVRRMEWCECGELLDDREWKIPQAVFPTDTQQT